jgi:hypothetical protein
MVANDRCNVGSEQFDRAHALLVRQGCNAHLKAKSGDSSECFTDRENLVGHCSRIANKQCTFRLKERFELTTRNRRPATLLANLGKGPGVTWKEFVRRLLIRIRNISQSVNTDFQLVHRVTSAAACLAVEINQGAKPAWFTADDGHHQRKAECSGACKRSRSPAHAEPDRKRSLIWPWIHCLPRKRRAVLTGPMNVDVFSNLQEQFKLAGKKRIVIGKIEAEKRKGFHERSAPYNHFGASMGEKVYSCELLKYAHGVIRAQNGDGTGETDPFGPDCRRGQDGLGRRIKKLRPVVLANPKDIQSNTIRRLDFVEKMAQAICRAEILARQGVRYRGHKTIDSDLHNPRLPSFFKGSE